MCLLQQYEDKVTLMSCRFGSYAELPLQITYAYTSSTLLPLPPNASLTLCRSTIDSATIILVFSWSRGWSSLQRHTWHLLAIHILRMAGLNWEENKDSLRQTNTCNIWLESLRGRGYLEGKTHGWEDNIKKDVTGIVCEYVDWNHLTQVKGQW
jgi:hypothetical protein